MTITFEIDIDEIQEISLAGFPMGIIGPFGAEFEVTSDGVYLERLTTGNGKFVIQAPCNYYPTHTKNDDVRNALWHALREGILSQCAGRIADAADAARQGARDEASARRLEAYKHDLVG